MRKAILWLAAVAILTLVAPAMAKFDAGLINVSFGNKDVVPVGKYVLGEEHDKWNTMDGATGEKAPLDNAKGDKSDATVTWSAAGVYDADDAGFVGTPFEKLLRKYLYSNEAQKVTINGLTPGAKYDLVAYSASNQGDRKTKFTIGGESKTTTYAIDNKELADGVNYAKFTATADADGNLILTYEGVDGAEGNLNGFQIAPAK